MKNQSTNYLFNGKAKPFLKWAGGKTQLINEIKSSLPDFVYDQEFTYIEPFVGSGAVLFWMLNNFSNLTKAIINDKNTDLINVYKVIKYNPSLLIEVLTGFEKEYHPLTQIQRKVFFAKYRNMFNSRGKDDIFQAALFIFLNRTCFNGLYRVNKKNEFNVPIGSYEMPMICDEDNIFAVCKILHKVEILNGDYEKTFEYASKNTLFYFDPPYKPLNKTSAFTSYSFDSFDDEEQIRLNRFCKKLDSHNFSWLLSNSDMKNVNIEDEFFDDLYGEFEIKRVNARRAINSDPNKRGKLKELLIKNYSLQHNYKGV